MSIKTGTATNYFDLLTILRDFLVNQGHAWGLTFTGTGNGRLVNAIGKVGTVVQTITCTATSSTNFTVAGSVTGAMGSATVGSPFTHAQCDFQINAGGTAFVAGDVFTFNLSPKWTLLRWGGCADATLRTSTAGTVANFFDDNSTTNGASVAAPYTVTVQMQAAIEVKAFSVWCGGSANGPTAFTVEYSDNGSSWTAAQSYSGQTWTITNGRNDYVFSSSAGSHLYWRITFTAGTSPVQVNEVKFFADTGFKWDCSNSFQFAFRAPGVDNAQQIHVLGRLNVNSGVGYWNVLWRGVRFWADQELSVTNVPNTSSEHCHPLNNNTIAYWIVANGGRFILMTRMSGIYSYSYCGFGLPYETPSNHPYPMIVGAPEDSITAIYSSTSSAAYRNPNDPGNGCLDVMLPSGAWHTPVNRQEAGSPPDGSGGSTALGKVWPWAQDSSGDLSVVNLMREALDGSKPILPAIIVINSIPHMWGEFDGVHWTTGFSNTAESLMQHGAIDYISFPNVYRSGVNHYCAIALD